MTLNCQYVVCSCTILVVHILVLGIIGKVHQGTRVNHHLVISPKSRVPLQSRNIFNSLDQYIPFTRSTVRKSLQKLCQNASFFN